jgi:hypothetical protein
MPQMTISQQYDAETNAACKYKQQPSHQGAKTMLSLERMAARAN